MSKISLKSEILTLDISTVIGLDSLIWDKN